MRKISLAIATVALGMLVAAGPVCVAQQKTQVIGAGSTFVYPIMTRWIASFHRRIPECRSTISRSAAAVAFSN